MFEFLKPFVETFQDFVLLTGRAFRNIFRSPHYADDIFQQMDIIGVGSIPIVLMIGFFSGSVMALQMARVARERHLSPDQVRALVEAHTEGRQFGFLGEPRVNVLLLNLALDSIAPLHH